MLLKKAQVKDFRCVEDSTEFSLEQVTCLVGKNESGKTSILKALHKLKPENHDKEQFKPDRDFPRRRWKPNEPTPKGQVVLTTWELSDDEWKTLEEEFGKGALKERTFTLSKGYDNVRRFGIAVHEPAVVKHLIASAELSADERKLCAEIKDLAALRKQLENIG